MGNQLHSKSIAISRGLISYPLAKAGGTDLIQVRLESNLHRKLNLPRRSGLTGGKTGTRDLPEGGSSNDGPRWAKVCMIKQVEEFSPKLHPNFFAHSGVFDDGKIDVIKTRTNNHVSSQVTEARNSGEHRSVEPTLNTAGGHDRSSDIWPECVGNAVNRAVTRNNVDRTAALRLNNNRQLPSFQQPAPAQWQVIYSAEDEPVARIKIRKPAISFQIVTVLPDDSSRAEGIVIQRFGPGIKGIELQIIRKALYARNPKCVVTGIPRALNLRDITKDRTWKNGARRGQSWKWTYAVNGLVQVST